MNHSMSMNSKLESERTSQDRFSTFSHFRTISDNRFTSSIRAHLSSCPFTTFACMCKYPPVGFRAAIPIGQPSSDDGRSPRLTRSQESASRFII